MCNALLKKFGIQFMGVLAQLAPLMLELLVKLLPKISVLLFLMPFGRQENVYADQDLPKLPFSVFAMVLKQEAYVISVLISPILS